MNPVQVPPAPPVTLVLFGASGDLTRRLLVPAMINMTRLGLAKDGLRILGVGIEPGDGATLRKALDDFTPEAGGEGAVEKGEAWKQLRSRIDYIQGDFTADAVYRQIAEWIAHASTGNAAFYLAVQPRFFGDIVDKLADNKLLDETPTAFRRIAIEKPFGQDLPSARALNARILKRVSESQVYRIDHFLGKETVQNIMTARFANMMIERLWTNDCIDHVQITAAETVDVGTRGKFYDSTGALRDMVPNHLFQLLAMVAMEPPNSFDAEAIRDEKGKVLRAIRTYSPEEAARSGVRGAYAAGKLDGTAVPAYTEVPNVAGDSSTETYVALKLLIDTWRWAGVPFYLRTGKVMAARNTEVVIAFKPVPFAQFGKTPAGSLPANRLIIHIQPDEGLSMDILIKRPGLAVDAVPVNLDFHYADRFDIAHQVGYESLLYDLFIGDQTLFQRADAIEAGWAAVQPFLDLWAASGKPDLYAPGSLGPDSADELLARDGRVWHELAAQVPKP
ncbi:MAG TPA: glucose-6-phosphate dehydrogenase [Aliidongia sp.]|uniref:glucose-6-phosphate dehydrogenase n=1 Tax=Aliidongia sp. TaxID=1914230 RepID=UPI002DDDB5FB|nr:glucose-6-phosphate dehydrogenase [Aliidongia sp.]HEV2673009.1 glucose-6-phosphate dehydrogenase [Aliidongia sp.]